MKIRKIFLLVCVLFFFSVITACSDSSGSSGGSQADTTAPLWDEDYPKIVELGDRVYIKTGLNENGHVYCVLLHNDSPVPTVQQIVDGQGVLPADGEVSADNITTLILADLSYSTEYDLYCIAEDEFNNMQASAVKIDVLTDAWDTVFVSQTDGYDSNMGTISLPKKTIGSAIASANASYSWTKVCVSQGTYNESVELAEGVSLFGGYSQSDWSERDYSLYPAVINGASGENYVISITGTDYRSGDWIIEGFTINTDETSTSQGLKCDADSLVLIRNNVIHGGFAQNESTAIYLTGEARTRILNNSIAGGSSETGDTCGILVETSGDQLIKKNSIFGGDGYTNTSFGIKITHPVDYDTIIINNNIDAGIAHNTDGIYITHDTDNETSTPLIYGNRITGGSGSDQYVIYLYGTADTRTISPVICNNIIENGTSLAAGDVVSLGIVAIDGYAYLYNNIIIGNSDIAGDIAGIIIAGNTDRESRVSVINNIIMGMGAAIVETDSFSFCDVLKNNDLYNCTYFFESSGSGSIDSISNLNGLRTNFKNNISIDAMLDSLWEFTSSSPTSVTEGGLDLSTYSYFQENSSGVEVDIAGALRTAPWSIGAYEKD